MKKQFDPYAVIKYPVATEKSMRLMESENKLIFIVDKSASKLEIRKALEAMFKVKILDVNTTISPKGRKKAYVQFGMDTPAIDVATNLGLL